MSNYIINRRADEKELNEVHTTTCNHLPESSNCVGLGYHANELEAVSYAKQNGWKNADGCYYCCRIAHSG